MPPYKKKYRKNYKKSPRSWISNLSVTGWLILINVLFSIAGLIVFAYFPEGINYLALKPSSIFQGEYLWTILTHMFIHGGIFHLFINMFVLFSLGRLSEKIIGRKRFFWFYIISGLFAGLLAILLPVLYGNSVLGARIFGSPDVFMVGASGAIFAIAGLFVILLPRLKFMIIFLPFFSLPAYTMIPLVLFLTWIVTIAGNFPIGNVAHFGGFLAGIAYGLYLKSKYKRKVKILQKMFR
jgi:uncharacterized protein